MMAELTSAVLPVTELLGLEVGPSHVVEEEVDEDRVIFHMRSPVHLVRRDAPDKSWYRVTKDTPAPMGTPVCPTCGELLTHRPPHRRFMENNELAQCPQGHLYRLEHIPTTGEVDDLGCAIVVQGSAT